MALVSDRSRPQTYRLRCEVQPIKAGRRNDIPTRWWQQEQRSSEQQLSRLVASLPFSFHALRVVHSFPYPWPTAAISQLESSVSLTMRIDLLVSLSGHHFSLRFITSSTRKRTSPAGFDFR